MTSLWGWLGWWSDDCVVGVVSAVSVVYVVRPLFLSVGLCFYIDFFVFLFFLFASLLNFFLSCTFGKTTQKKN